MCVYVCVCVCMCMCMCTGAPPIARTTIEEPWVSNRVGPGRSYPEEHQTLKSAGDPRTLPKEPNAYFTAVERPEPNAEV